MNTTVYSELYKNYLIVVEQDIYHENPIKDVDFLGTMVCWHRKYVLGHEQPKETPTEYTIGLLLDVCQDEIANDHRFIEYDNDDIEEFLRDNPTILQEYFSKYFYNLSLFLYDHSEVSISTLPFSSRWDSGKIGFIFVSKKRASEEGFTDEVEVYRVLKAEVDMYNDYLLGNVYGYQIFEVPTDFVGCKDDLDSKTLVCLDSLWGIYPNHNTPYDYDEAVKQAKDYIDYLSTQINDGKEVCK